MSASTTKPTLYLHIGTEKTGTTTLQALGSLNRALLLKNGLFYPASPGDRNHTGLAFYAADGAADDLVSDPSMTTKQGREQFRERFAHSLRTEVAHSKAPAVWISNEHLSSRLKGEEEVNRIAALLKPIFQTVKVVAYLRHQPELYVSFLSTSVKSGGGLDRPPPTDTAWQYYNYELMLEKWAAAFGRENIIARVYDKRVLAKGDIIDDFFNAIGMKMPEGLVRPEVMNRRLDRATIHFLELFNQFAKRSDGNYAPVLAGDIVQALENMSNGPAFTVDPDILRRIDRLFAPSNQRVAELYFGRSSPLFPSGKFPDLPAGPPLTVTKAVSIGLELWRYKQTQLGLYKPPAK